jgi:hypothetical protein
MTPNHAAPYPHDLQRSVIKKRLALSKQVLPLSARHFYIRPPFPPPLSLLSFLSLLLTRPQHHSSPVGLHAQRPCLPPYQTKVLQTQRMELFDGRISSNTPPPTCFWLESSLFRTLAILSKHSPCSWIAASHIWCLWTTKAGSKTILWQVKAATRLHRIRREMAVVKPVNLVLLYPTDNSSPGELIVAETQDSVEMVLRDALWSRAFQIAWFRWLDEKSWTIWVTSADLSAC